MRKRLSAWSPIIQALAKVKAAPISQANLQSAIKAALARVPTRHLSMKMKVEKLRLTKSDDPIQQLQSGISGIFTMRSGTCR
jgi:hypothetical protein